MTEPHRIEWSGRMAKHEKGCLCVVCRMEVRVHRMDEKEPTELEKLVERALKRLSRGDKVD